MTASSDDLRRAVAACSPRERAAMQRQAADAAERWRPTLPRVARVWAAFAAVVAEVAELDAARRAATEGMR